ncbi:hypothetical protein NDI37_15620 [Funiculus sociatus GB2-A5]|jgi:hypothetical protein|uniref:Uncharacterized protein n=1 Tax=Funiculus sociatus GB2-A5 TaxID=2933946 RepID=A0ABV0JT90_9CYAN|nr:MULTISPECIES: hypothetical protein [unclassified Trichocoleus]MBD1907694.1 hypothetical protein [Trichocoleus sp. FACHB-832]MBD2004383.1 hypothetical protein [Trichocoleus sp. FACHB-40]MBD2061289.1 hypothetical protein [Trichocoleus sp. FACHB-6]
MEETIRIRAVDKSDWSSVVEGFDIETIQDVLEVVGADGQKIGLLCETEDGNSYINGQPETAYISLQAAATALLKGKE